MGAVSLLSRTPAPASESSAVPEMPKPDLVSQRSAGEEASAGDGEALALVTRLCREPDLGVGLFWRWLGTGEAWSCLLAPEVVVPWLTTEEGRVDLGGTGVARVTVCRCEAEAEEVGAGLPASFGVTGRRFARAGAWGGWREDVDEVEAEVEVEDEGAAVEERS